MAALRDIAYGLADGAISALIDHRAELADFARQAVMAMGAGWREAMATTAVDAPADPAMEQRLQQVVRDAVDAGEAPKP